MLLQNPFLPPGAVTAGMWGNRFSLLVDQTPSCFHYTPGELFLSMGTNSKAGHIHLPHAYSLRKAQLTALAHSQSILAEKGSSPLSAGWPWPCSAQRPPLCAKGMSLPHVDPKGAPVSGRARAGRWEGNSPPLTFFTFISAGLDFFLRTKLDLQAKSVCSGSV